MIKSSENRQLNEKLRQLSSSGEPIKGRPVYYLTEEYYRVLPSQCDEIGEGNWKEMVSDSPAFCYRECREGVLYYKVRKK